VGATKSNETLDMLLRYIYIQRVTGLFDKYSNVCIDNLLNSPVTPYIPITYIFIIFQQILFSNVVQ